MLTGNTVTKDQPTEVGEDLPTLEGWTPIVNADIKLANLVLNDAHANYYPAYKTLQMIDFGLAFNDNRLHNEAEKHVWTTYGTRGHCPPVSVSYFDAARIVAKEHVGTNLPTSLRIPK